MEKSSAQISLYRVIDIKAVYRYFTLQSSKPTKPTTYPPSSIWTTTEPTYTSGSTKSLYTVVCAVFANVNKTNNTITLNSAWNHGGISSRYDGFPVKLRWS